MKIDWKVWGLLWVVAVGLGCTRDEVGGLSDPSSDACGEDVCDNAPCEGELCDVVEGAGDVDEFSDGKNQLDSIPVEDIWVEEEDTSPELDGVEAPEDAGVVEDVGEVPPEWGEPLSALPGAWTWVDFPSTHCADGSPTGLGINLQPGATKVLIYFEGGGACWNYNNCFGLVQTSFHLGGYGESDFEDPLAAVYKQMFLFDREAEENPFADAHYVFVPYCTGDAFAGDHVTELQGLLPWSEGTIYFKGHHNIKEYLQRLVPTFQDVDRVYAGGSSAGGFGVGLNWITLSDAFAPIPVDILDDSGPPVEPAEGRWKEWQEAWNVPLPDDCVGCSESLGSLVEYFQETMLSNGRLALMSYTHDTVISVFFGIFSWDFASSLDALCAVFDTEPNAQYFLVSGGLHTMTIAGMNLIQASDGTSLLDWLQQMVDEDPNWGSHAP